MLAPRSWHVVSGVVRSPPRWGFSAFLAFVASSALVLLALKEPLVRKAGPKRGMDGQGLGLCQTLMMNVSRPLAGRGQPPECQNSDRQVSPARKYFKILFESLERQFLLVKGDFVHFV